MINTIIYRELFTRRIIFSNKIITGVKFIILISKIINYEQWLHPQLSVTHFIRWIQTY